MNIILVKIVVMCALTIKVTMPMENQLCQYEVEQGRLELLSFENKINVGILTVQAASFALLKKNNALFDAELISTNRNSLRKFLLASSACLGLWATAVSILLNTMPAISVRSNLNSGISTVLVIGSMLHWSNLIYDDLLMVLKKRFSKLRPQLIIKNPADILALEYAKCVICYEDQSSNEYINPCEQEDHIFCMHCLIACFDVQKKRASFANKYSFLCEVCRKEVPFNDEKFEVGLPPQPKVTLELWARQVGPMVIFYGIGCYLLMKILQCQFS